MSNDYWNTPIRTNGVQELKRLRAQLEQQIADGIAHEPEKARYCTCGARVSIKRGRRSGKWIVFHPTSKTCQNSEKTTWFDTEESALDAFEKR